MGTLDFNEITKDRITLHMSVYDIKERDRIRNPNLFQQDFNLDFHCIYNYLILYKQWFLRYYNKQ